jgi:hypothetical protein
MAVARFTRAGLLDRRFGHRGTVQMVFWNADLAASAGVTSMALTRGGDVIGSGHLDYIGSDGHGSAGVFRISPTGRFVRAFGGSGHVEVAFTNARGGFAQWFPCATTLDRSGRVTVTGDGSAGSAAGILSARLTASRLPDSSYGSTGDGRAVILGLRGDNDTTCGGALTAAGALTVGVGSTLGQLRPDGSADNRVAAGGLIRIARPPQVSVNAVVRGHARSRRRRFRRQRRVRRTVSPARGRVDAAANTVRCNNRGDVRTVASSPPQEMHDAEQRGTH